MSLHSINEFIGLIGGISLSLCSIPQSWQSYKQGHSDGLSPAYLFFWYFGEIIMLYYAIAELGSPFPLIINYLFNIILLTIIIKYAIWPRK